MVGRTNASVVLQTIRLEVVKQQNSRIYSDQGEFLVGTGDPFHDHQIQPAFVRMLDLKPGDVIIANYIPTTNYNIIIDFIKI